MRHGHRRDASPAYYRAQSSHTHRRTANASREVNGAQRASPGRSHAGPFPFEDPRGCCTGRLEEIQEQVFTGGQKEIDAARKRADEAEHELMTCRRTLEEAHKDVEVKKMELEVVGLCVWWNV